MTKFKVYQVAALIGKIRICEASNGRHFKMSELMEEASEVIGKEYLVGQSGLAIAHLTRWAALQQ